MCPVAAAVTYARLRVVILQFHAGQSDTVLTSLLWQDGPRGIRYQHHYTAQLPPSILFRRDLKTELFIRRTYH